MRLTTRAGCALAILAVTSCGPRASHDSTPLAEPAAPKPASWIYDSKPDTMRDGVSYVGCLPSTTQAKLSAPYESQALELCVVHAADHDVRALLRLPQGGQFACHDCRIQVRFGKAELETVDAAAPQDGASDVLMLTDGRTIAYRLATETPFQAEPVFYENGSQVIEFPAIPLDKAAMHLPAKEVDSIVQQYTP